MTSTTILIIVFNEGLGNTPYCEGNAEWTSNQHPLYSDVVKSQIEVKQLELQRGYSMKTAGAYQIIVNRYVALKHIYIYIFCNLESLFVGMVSHFTQVKVKAVTNVRFPSGAQSELFAKVSRWWDGWRCMQEYRQSINQSIRFDSTVFR